MPRGRGKGGRGGKGQGKGPGVQVHSIYQYATSFLLPLQQDVLMGLVQEDIVVVPGTADKIETVLGALSIEFLSVPEFNLGAQELKPTQIVFVNCCANCGEGAATALAAHMRAGGVVVSTDHESQHLLEKVFPDVIQHVPLGGNHDARLSEVDEFSCASCCFPKDANWHIDGGAYGVRVLDPCKCNVLVKSPDVKEQNVVVEIPCGKGRSVHLISHFEQVSRHMGGTAATPIEISSLAARTGVRLSDDELKKIANGGVGIRQLQTAVAGIGMLVNLLLLGKLGSQYAEAFSSERRAAKSRDRAPAPNHLSVSPQALLYNLSQSPVTLHSDVSADGRVQELRKLVVACVGAGAHLFPLKLAAHLRREGGHRETALCLLAMAFLENPTSEITFASQSILKEPSALVRVPEWMEALCKGCGTIMKWSHCLKKSLQVAFARLVSLEGLARLDRATQAKLQRVVKVCHISEPRPAIVALLGKRCPGNAEDWKEMFGSDLPVDPDMFDLRLRVPRQAAAVKLSAAGKVEGEEGKRQAWEELLLEGNLTPKELARNLRSMMSSQLSDAALTALLQQLQGHRFARGLTMQQLYVAWRESEGHAQVRGCLSAVTGKRPPEKGVLAKSILVLLDVSPSMSRPCGAGTSSTSCKEAGVLFAEMLHKGWAANATDKGRFRVCTFPREGAPSSAKEADLEAVPFGAERHCFDLAVDLNDRSVLPSDERSCVPWEFLLGGVCGEFELVVLLTDHDPTMLPRWSSLAMSHHAAARTWWQIRSVNLRGTGDSPVGSQVINGCDEAAVRRVTEDQGAVLRRVHNLVFERLPAPAASAAVVMLKTQCPWLNREVLKLILRFASPLTLLEKKLSS